MTTSVAGYNTVTWTSLSTGHEVFIESGGKAVGPYIVTDQGKLRDRFGVEFPPLPTDVFLIKSPPPIPVSASPSPITTPKPAANDIWYALYDSFVLEMSLHAQTITPQERARLQPLAKAAKDEAVKHIQWLLDR